MKTIASCFLILCIICVITLPTHAEVSPSMYGEITTVQAGSEIVFSVFISGNPGLSAFRVLLAYDTDNLSPKFRDDGTLCIDSGAVATAGMLISGRTEQGCQVLWSGSPSAMDGILFTVTFQTDPHASGEHSIAISCVAEDTLDSTGKSVSFECNPGTILIEKIAVIEVGSACGLAGESVIVPVMLHNNPGFATAVMTFRYDDTALELTAIRKGTLLTSDSGSFSRNVDAGKVAWFDSLNTQGDGVLFELEFTVLAQTDYAETAVAATLTNGFEKNFGTAEGDAISVYIIDGTVTHLVGLLLVEGLEMQDDGSLCLMLKDASSDAVNIVIASYSNRKMISVHQKIGVLNPGNNIFTHDHPASADELKLFILDSETMVPCCAAISLDKGGY